jgi:hypothetical protein
MRWTLVALLLSGCATYHEEQQCRARCFLCAYFELDCDLLIEVEDGDARPALDEVVQQ